MMRAAAPPPLNALDASGQGAGLSVPKLPARPSARALGHEARTPARGSEGTSVPIVAGLALGAVGAFQRASPARKQTRASRAGAAAPAGPAVVPAPQEAGAPAPPAAPEVPLACPVCQRAVPAPGPAGTDCQACGLSFPRRAEGDFTDLTLTAASPLGSESPDEGAAQPARQRGLLQRLPFVETTDAIAKAVGLPQSREVESLASELLSEPQRWLGRPSQPISTATFQNPLVSFAYERGWRRSFATSGFPGVDEELRLAQGFLAEGAQDPEDADGGGVLLDASCGSGLFSRRFAASGKYRAVVALDFSASMLRQVDDFARQDIGPDYAMAAPGRASLTLVRADIARLPFESSSLGAVHASAAIHCWPSPENAVAEVARVLRPGGVFVLSTFRPRGPLYGAGANTAYRFWEEEELRTLTRQCGLVDFQAITREPAFIMVRVRKPNGP